MYNTLIRIMHITSLAIFRINILYGLYYLPSTNLLRQMSYFMIVFSYSNNLFIYYLFDKNLKKEIHKMFFWCCLLFVVKNNITVYSVHSKFVMWISLSCFFWLLEFITRALPTNHPHSNNITTVNSHKIIGYLSNAYTLNRPNGPNRP